MQRKTVTLYYTELLGPGNPNTKKHLQPKKSHIIEKYIIAIIYIQA